jgi:hypothetical protein
MSPQPRTKNANQPKYPSVDCVMRHSRSELAVRRLDRVVLGRNRQRLPGSPLDGALCSNT